MTQRFDYFVVFAEMRTGSNFLETNINAFPSLTCYGEAFNPHFIGYPNSTEILGITQEDREKDPLRLLAQIAKASHGLGGFRYFHDHDPRILDAMLADHRCAKIVLTRNPIDSYVSWKIAQATGQWKLTNLKKRREEKAVFDRREFEEHLTALQEFQITLQNRLQVTGQTAFYVAYEDLQSVEVMNGMAAWLGIPDRLEELDKSLKRQNPQPIADKVENFDDMERALVRLDRFNLTRTPNFEPRRGPVVPSYVAGVKTPLLYMPLRSGPEEAVKQWLASLDGVGADDLLGEFSQKSLRQWKNANPQNRSFTVVRHPLARAHAAFCEKIVATGKGSFAQIRRNLNKHYNLGLPDEVSPDTYGINEHRNAFHGFLRFIKANLSGQTSIRTDGHWATQSLTLTNMGEFALPDLIVREHEMETYLPALAMQAGNPSPADPTPAAQDVPYTLADIYDDTMEQLCRDAYGRDYTMFGYQNWTE